MFFQMIVQKHIFKKSLTFKVSVLNVRIYEQVKREVIWEYSILDLHTQDVLHYYEHWPFTSWKKKTLIQQNTTADS